jgi:2-dehydro-3-deoxyphosphogluconate aldolase/(4S)-4-hydroxy-2-oxoglutarate aldolase
MNKREEDMQRFVDTGIMAIIRLKKSVELLQTVEALLKGGVSFLEVSLTTPDALQSISSIHHAFGRDITLGAGTVLDSEAANAAILAGVDFIVSPILKIDVVNMARRYGKLCFLGAYTPSEALLAWEAGSDAVKLFPAMPAGPEYLKAIHAPFPQISFVAVGGVSLEIIQDWFHAGAIGVAGASNLVNPKFVETGKFDQIEKTAQAWIKAARSARE